MPVPIAALIAAVPELVGLGARAADWIAGLAGVSRQSQFRKAASSLSNLSGLASMLEVLTPQAWSGEKDPLLSGASTAVGILSSFGAGMAPKIAAKTAGQTGRLAKLGQLYTKEVGLPSKFSWLEKTATREMAPGAWKHKALWTVPSFIRGFAEPSAAEPDTTQGEPAQIPAVVPWRSPAEAALVAATAGYSGQYRGYLDTLENRTKAQQQALSAVLPSYAPALNELGEAADVYQQEHLRRAEMLRQLLEQMNQTVPYMQPMPW